MKKMLTSPIVSVVTAIGMLLCFPFYTRAEFSGSYEHASPAVDEEAIREDVQRQVDDIEDDAWDDMKPFVIGIGVVAVVGIIAAIIYHDREDTRHSLSRKTLEPRVHLTENTSLRFDLRASSLRTETSSQEVRMEQVEPTLQLSMQC